MTKNHLKRMAVPKTWPTKRKGITFITRPNPCGHTLSMTLPLTVVLRDLLEIAKRSREVSRILEKEEVLLNGNKAKDKKASVGLMDILSIPKANIHVRMVLNKKGKLSLEHLDAKETNSVQSQIVKKTTIKKQKKQITLRGGMNLLVDKDDYKVGDTLVVQIPKLQVQEHLPRKEGANIMLIGGKHTGERGTIEAISDNHLIYKNKEGKSIQTLKKYAFVMK